MNLVNSHSGQLNSSYRSIPQLGRPQSGSNFSHIDTSKFYPNTTTNAPRQKQNSFYIKDGKLTIKPRKKSKGKKLSASFRTPK